MQDNIWPLILFAAAAIIVIGGLAMLSQHYTLDNIKSRTVGKALPPAFGSIAGNTPLVACCSAVNVAQPIAGVSGPSTGKNGLCGAVSAG